MKSKDPDFELVQACQDPSDDRFEGAFSQLYEKYKDRVYNIAWRVTGNAAEAMDVCQETFVLLLRNISGFKFGSKFSSWLYRIVVNNSIDSKRRMTSRGRREGRIPIHPDSGQQVEIRDDGQTLPDQDLLHKEKGEMVQEGISRLSPKLRVITILRYMEGLSYEELSETLDISLGTVKSRLARAHLALAKSLGAVLEVREEAEKGAPNHKSGEPESI